MNKNSFSADKKQRISGRKIFIFLAPYLKRQKWAIVAMFVLSILASLFAYAEPLIQQELINSLTLKKFDFIWWLVIGMMVLMGGNRLFVGISTFLGQRVATKTTLNLEKSLTRKLLDIPSSFFAQKGSSYLAQRVSSDIDTMSKLYSSLPVIILLNLLKLVGCLILLFILDWRIGLVAFFLLPIYMFLNTLFKRYNFPLKSELIESHAQQQRKLNRSLTGITLIKSSAAEDRIGYKLGREFERLAILRLKHFNLINIFNFILQILPGIAQAILLLIGIYMIQHDAWTMGKLWALLRYLGFVLVPSQLLIQQFMSYHNATIAAQRVIELNDILPEKNLESGIEVEQLKGKIEFSKVSFGYQPDKLVLNDFSFVINPKEHVALIGPSGSGKSTIIALILRLYQSQKGTIKIDDIPIENYNLRNLRCRIGYISQEIDFIPGSLAENMRLGSKGYVSDEKLIETLELVGARDLLKSLPAGLQSPIFDQAENLSGGEKLRIATARELLRDCDIFILDEATANLDAESEEKIMTMLKEQLKDKTIINISHRISTQSYAERIIKLNYIS